MWFLQLVEGVRWWWCVVAGRTGITAGVCAVLFILLLISGGIVWQMCHKKAKKDNYTAKRLGW